MYVKRRKEISTIQVEKPVYENLKKIKGEQTFNQLIESLLENYADVEEAHNIHRDRIAFEVIFQDHIGKVQKIHKVSFYELQNAMVGQTFQPESYDCDDYYLETAQVVFKDDISAIVRVKIKEFNKEVELFDSYVLNVNFY